MPQVQNVLQGQAETTDYRVSSKVPARVLELRVSEGDFVHRGDTLVRLDAPDINAKLSQAEAAYAAANAQDEKAKNGTRAEQVQQAYEMYPLAELTKCVLNSANGLNIYYLKCLLSYFHCLTKVIFYS